MPRVTAVLSPPPAYLQKTLELAVTEKTYHMRKHKCLYLSDLLQYFIYKSREITAPCSDQHFPPYSTVFLIRANLT